MIKVLSVFVFLIISSFISAETKVYGVAHIGITHEDSDFKMIDRSSYIGLKGATPLETSLYMTFKFEVGVDFTKHSIDSIPSVRYSFVGLKGDFGEFRIGRQDSAYDIVDNSMDNFLTEQANGMITENQPVNLVAFIKKIGSVGFYGTHIHSSDDSEASSSIMINHASGSVYTGLGFVKEKGNKNKTGVKFVVTYKKDNYGIGLIHERCPSSQNVQFENVARGGCDSEGGENINNLSAVYSFGKPYIAAQTANNSRTHIKKNTLELGTILGRGAKAYIELDKTGSDKTTTVGIKTSF